MAVIRDIQASEFESVIAKGTVMVEFWATWCRYCRMMEPVVKQAAEAAPAEAVIARLDVDQAQELATKYEVNTVPAFFCFREGKLVSEFSGVQTKTKLADALK